LFRMRLGGKAGWARRGDQVGIRTMRRGSGEKGNVYKGSKNPNCVLGLRRRNNIEQGGSFVRGNTQTALT